MSGLAVFFGGGLGALARYGLMRITAFFGLDAAWGIFATNLLGALAMGLLLGFSLARFELSEQTRLFLITGVLGGFTTFSTLTADIVRLSERSWGLSLLYIIASVAGGIALIIIGLRIGRNL